MSDDSHRDPVPPPPDRLYAINEPVLRHLLKMAVEHSVQAARDEIVDRLEAGGPTFRAAMWGESSQHIANIMLPKLSEAKVEMIAVELKAAVDIAMVEAGAKEIEPTVLGPDEKPVSYN